MQDAQVTKSLNEKLFQKVQQRYTRLMNTIYFLVLLLTNHETPYNLEILCWASFWANQCPFYIYRSVAISLVVRNLERN